MKRFLIYSVLILFLVLAFASQLELSHDHDVLHIEDDCFCNQWLIGAIFILTLLVSAGLLMLPASNPLVIGPAFSGFFRVKGGKSPPPILFRRFMFNRPPPLHS